MAVATGFPCWFGVAQNVEGGRIRYLPFDDKHLSFNEPRLLPVAGLWCGFF
jgi:hypothetical protein